MSDTHDLPLVGVRQQTACGCGEHDHDIPELDARTIPHAIRHASILGALAAVPAGGSMILVAPHNPLPLLHQIDEREHGSIEVTYLQQEPEEWRLKLTRTA
jgi:uncharacterized protein (DUF2249 family)